MQPRKRKGVVQVREGEKILFYDIYEGESEGLFYLVRSETADHQLKSVKVFPGQWVRFEKDREAAHLEALRQENLQATAHRGLASQVM